ncbi:MAG: aminoglycoside phosphotransferase family protein [Gammaproteobacteria bacterium]|nr:aminoglycoside phosphotransferase family protein [Gammaproteobacteria bacterium]MDE0269986.1 aminoglycoside phosphotransferase family protein [Gammaproteobacteria bacterium]
MDDTAFWAPAVAAVLERHGWAGSRNRTTAGVGATYPTFLHGDLVIKLFGGQDSWRASFRAERAALAAVAGIPGLAAPRLLAEGWLQEGADQSWPYLVMTRMQGVPWGQADLSPARRLRVAAELGEQARLLWSLRPDDVPALESMPVPALVAAAERSSLPARLIAQIGGFLAGLGPFGTAFVHSDLMHRHVYVAGGHLAGIIDWGDAALADSHYELAKLHLDLFDGDKALLRAFLEPSGWQAGSDFAQQALALALHRQAQGLMQHRTMDVFHKLPHLLPPNGATTLDQLANRLFAI